MFTAIYYVKFMMLINTKMQMQNTNEKTLIKSAQNSLENV
jgi:hypothetical protein